MCKVTAVSNQKGGVGKTTTTGALIAIKASHGARVLAIDFDPIFNLTKLHSGDMVFTRAETCAAVFTGEANIRTLIRKSQTTEGVDFIPSCSEMNANYEGNELMFKEQIDSLREEYDYIFIDCPPQINFIVLSAYIASDQVLGIITPGGWELDGLEEIYKAIQSVKFLNPYVQFKVVKNKFSYTSTDRRTRVAIRLTDNALGQIKELEELVCESFIPLDTKVDEAQFYSKDIFSHDRTTNASKALVRLSDEVL